LIIDLCIDVLIDWTCPGPDQVHTHRPCRLRPATEDTETRSAFSWQSRSTRSRSW